MKKRKFDKSAPRYQAGSMKLPDGAGEITKLFSYCDFLEIFTEHASYKVRSPESIDPEETNPNAPWVTSKASDFGSSNKVVARILLQSEEMLNTAMFKEGTINKGEVLKLIYECKDALLICEKIYQRVKDKSDEIAKELNDNGLSVENGGRYINSFPQIPNLDEEATNYLINIKRSIGKICFLVEMFLPVDKRDNNVEHIVKRIKKLNNPNYDKLIEFLNNYKDGIKHLIELRNYQEHPGEKVTNIENYKLMPDGKISVPFWYVTGKESSSIIDEMGSAIDYVISLNETMLVHLIFLTIDSIFPYFVEEILDENIDKKTPIKYRLSIDVSQIKFEK